MRVERVELSTEQFLKLPPLPLGYTRAQAPDAEGGIRTHNPKDQFLRLTRLPFTPLPRITRYWRWDSNPQKETRALDALNVVRLPVPPLQLES